VFAFRSVSRQSLHAAQCPTPTSLLSARLQTAATDDSGDTHGEAPAGSQPIERVSFLPSPAAADGPAPGAAQDTSGKADGGEGPAREAPMKPLLAAKIQKEVSAPLAGVQTALIMDVPIWEHTKTFRSLSHGLYVMPKACLFSLFAHPLCA